MINKYAAAQRLNSALMRNALRKQAAIDWANVGATVGGGALTSGAVMGVHALINKLLGRKGSWLEYLASGVPAAFAGGYAGNRLLAGHRQAVGNAAVAGWNAAYGQAGPIGQLLIDANGIADQLKKFRDDPQAVSAAFTAQLGSEEAGAKAAADYGADLYNRLLDLNRGLRNNYASAKTLHNLGIRAGLVGEDLDSFIGKENISRFNGVINSNMRQRQKGVDQRLADHRTGQIELSPRTEYAYMFEEDPEAGEKVGSKKK